MGRPYDRRAYRRNRAILLASNPPCSVEGCPLPATTVDHIRPVSKMGNNDLPNLRPMCLPHNSARGNKVIKRYAVKW